jgi:hypothetical protein
LILATTGLAGYAVPMAAKNKSKSRPAPASPMPDQEEILALHRRATKRRDELLEDVRELKAAGKRKKAKVMLREAQTIQEWLGALEAEVPTLPAQPD